MSPDRFPALLWLRGSSDHWAGVALGLDAGDEIVCFFFAGNETDDVLEELRKRVEHRRAGARLRPPPAPELQEIEITTRLGRLPVCVLHGQLRDEETGAVGEWAIAPMLELPGHETPGVLVPAGPDALSRLRLELDREIGRLSPQAIVSLLPPARRELTAVTPTRGSTGSGRSWLAPPPTLSEVAEPLETPSRRRSRAWEREHEVSRLVDALGDRRASVLLVGENGSGKSQVLADAWGRVRRRATSDRVAWTTDASRVRAGMRYLGDWQSRCLRLVQELEETGGLLVLGGLRDLLAGGEAEASWRERPARDSIAAFLLPFIERGSIQVAIECTPDELALCERLLLELVVQLEVHVLEPMSRDAARRVLAKISESSRREHGRTITDPACTALVDLCDRFVSDRPRPGLAADLVRQLLAAESEGAPISVTEATAHFARWSGLPPDLLDDDVPWRPDEVEGLLAERVLGQPTACAAVARRLLAFKAGMIPASRPLGVLLFAGPSGVGKTALARALADLLFGAGERDQLIRLDLGELTAPGAADRLWVQRDGSPSDLVRRVRTNPFAVVLLDEIEKASAEVRGALRGVLESGTATDVLGRTTTFRNCLFVLTTNAGSRGAASAPLGFLGSAESPLDERALREELGAELVLACDDLIAFEPLAAETVRAIVRKELAALAGREGFRDRHIRLVYAPELVDHVAETGFDPAHGARPLQRVLEREVVAPIARLLVSQPDLEGVALLLHRDADGILRLRVE